MGNNLHAARAARGNGSLGSIVMRGQAEWELLGEGAGFCSRTSALSVLAESNYTQVSL